MNGKSEFELVTESVAKFPAEFGLRCDRRNRFRLNAASSYLINLKDAHGTPFRTVRLRVEVLLDNGNWELYGFGTQEHLLSQAVCAD